MTEREAIRTVLRGFDEGVFVRSIDKDGDPAWAIKLFPYIHALRVLSGLLGDPEGPQPDWIHGEVNDGVAARLPSPPTRPPRKEDDSRASDTEYIAITEQQPERSE